MRRVVSDLTLAAAVNHSQTPTTLLELHLATGQLQLAVLTAGACTSKKATTELYTHVIVYSQ